jgi:hypothetical protein
MTHPRQTIIEAIAARLKAPIAPAPGPSYRTEAGPRCWTGRTKPLFAKDLPAILVYMGREKIDPDDSGADGNGPLKRILLVQVEIVAAVNEGLDAALNRVAWQVEAALADLDVGDHRTASFDLVETEPFLSGEGEKALGILRMTWQTVYWTHRPESTEGIVPSQVLGSWVPRIGVPHKPEYVDVTGLGDMPPAWP